jgi:APA family basic amino acid/polyamine antiporter
VVGGLPSFAAENLRPFAPHGWGGVAESSALLFFAYTGYARLATLGEEVKEPEKTIPRAIVLTLVLSFVIYLAVGTVAVGGTGADALAATRSPLEKAAGTFATPWIARFLAVGAATAMLGVLLSQILGISRMMLAMARRGDLPGFLAKVDGKRGVPARGILLTGAIALSLAWAGTLEVAIAAAAFTILIYYAVTNLSAIRLPRARRLYAPWIAWAGLFTCLAMAASLQFRTISAGLGLLAAGFIFRGVLHRLSPPDGNSSGSDVT